MIEIKAPQLPESVSEGILARWCKQPGEAVKRDEVIAELETDKVILEIPAPQDGVLNELICQEEDTVVSEQLLAYIVPQSAAAVEAPAAAPAEAAAPASAPVMPAASQEGLRQGISMDQVTGSGNGGRVLKEDVVRAAEAQKAPVQTPEPVVTKAPATPIISGSREERREPMSRLRARVAERLLESQRENAILTTFNEVNMQPVMDLRKRWKDDFAAKHDVKLGFMSFFVKAATSALREFPILNASVDGKDIIWHDYCDIGIAVSSPRGLVVPALRNAEQMSIKEIESQIAEYAVQARNGKLPLEALQGGTFSITNGGTFGSMMSTPIINPPQSAILGMHAITPRAVVEDGNIVIRPMMYLALSYDHRIIDGQEAVQALVHIRRLLESPERFLLDI